MPKIYIKKPLGGMVIRNRNAIKDVVITVSKFDEKQTYIYVCTCMCVCENF